MASVVIFSCAVSQKPNGGPKDITPPRLLKATPLNMTHNFNSKTIRMDFDEYFKLTNPYQEIVISPAQEKQPEYKTSKRSLIITLKDTLLKNTTYVINFGKALADVNEGNIKKNFTYVFSTGTHIDSLSLSGNVINVQTQEREKDVTVMLFTPREDSLRFGKKRPTIFATTDTAGNFTISNRHEGKYRLYALKETSPNRIYDNEDELIGFPSRIVDLQNDTTGIQIKLFKQVPVKFRLPHHEFNRDGSIFLVFNRPVAKPSVRVLYPPALDAQKYVDISKTRDTALIYMKTMDFDSLKVAIYENGKPIDTVALHKGRKESFDKIVTIRTSADAGNLLKPGTDLKISANMPITSFDPNGFVLTEDSTIVNNYTLTQDSVNLKNFTLSYKWKQKANYLLTINEGALTDIFGDKNKKQPRKFIINKPDNYGQLALTVNIPDTSKAYIVELYNEQNTFLRSDRISKKQKIVYKDLITAKYRIKVVYDDNKNGVWDTGSVKANRQPENIFVYKTLITIRPSWENEATIDVPRELP